MENHSNRLLEEILYIKDFPKSMMYYIVRLSIHHMKLKVIFHISLIS